MSRTGLVAITIAAFAFFTSCSKFDEPESHLSPEEQKTSQTNEQTDKSERPKEYASEFVLADDPFLLENVQKAYDIIAGDRQTRAEQLQATHHYVRFLPQDTTHLDILIDSLRLPLFAYPYNLGLTPDEMDEHKNTQINGFPWQYCLVEADYPMPTEMQHELLAEVYYQPEGVEDDVMCGHSEQGPGTRSGGGRSPQLSPELYDEVFKKTLELTGRAREEEGPQTRGEWYPSAKIMYRDPILGDMPMKGIQVVVQNRALVIFDNSSCITDANGHAYMRKPGGAGFWDNLQFILRFNGPQWNMKDGDKNGYAEWYDWTGLKSDPGLWNFAWEHTIDGSGHWQDAFYAAIHKALNEFYNEWHPRADWLAKRHGNGTLKVRAYWGDTNLATYGRGTPNIIKMYSQAWDIKGNLHKYSNPEIMSVTFHELGHGAHLQGVIDRNLGRETFYEKSQVQERWAMGVQYVYTSDIYPNNYTNYYTYNGYDADDGDDQYTAIIESLMHQGFPLWELQDIFMGNQYVWDCYAQITDYGYKYGITTNLANLIFNNEFIPLRTNMSQITMTGPDKPVANVGASYSVPVVNNSLSYRYTVTPNTGISGNLNSRTPTIRFTNPGRYTITANYTFPSGGTYPVSKVVNVAPAAPVISANKTSVGWNEAVTFTVNNHQPGTTYKWYTGDPNALYATIPTGTVGVNTYTTTLSSQSLRVYCQASVNGQVSANSNAITVTKSGFVLNPGGGEWVLNPGLGGGFVGGGNFDDIVGVQP